MKSIPILLPSLLIFTLTIFLIILSQAISKEVEHDTKEPEHHKIKENYTYTDDRVDGLWIVEKGMNEGEMLISVNAEKIHADKLLAIYIKDN